jgi:hypothetical protein
MDHLQNIQQVFTGRFFRIPNYQRGYAWEAKHVDDLLEDLDILGVDDEHYAGTLVLHKDELAKRVMDQDGRDHSVYDIVDGQQRMTTIVMLLDCIRRALPEGSQLRSGIGKTYVTTANLDGFDQARLTLNRDTREFFEANVIADRRGVEGPQIRSHELLAAAHERMSAYLEHHAEQDGWLLELYKKVTTGLKLTVYEVPRTSDVGVIFEVMNNRGKPLSEMEKVKNYLLYVTSKMRTEAGQHVADQVNLTWSKLFELLMAADASSSAHEDQLLRAHWLMAYDFRPKNWAGSDSIKSQFSVKKVRSAPSEVAHAITEYLKSLQQFAVTYCDIVAPSRSDSFLEYRSEAASRKEIQRAAEKLTRLRVIAGFLPIIGAVRMTHPGDAAVFLALLEVCERYAFRVYRFAGFRSNAGQTGFFKLAHDVYEHRVKPADVIASILASLEYYAPEQAFRAALQKPSNWYEHGGIKYLLYEYEEHLAAGRPVQLPWEQFLKSDKKDSVEHVLPQTWTDPYWVVHWRAEEAGTYLHDIGNLSLTFTNSSYGNKSFPRKKGQVGAGVCYANASTFMERKLAAYADWTAAECTARRAQVVAWIVERWGTEVPADSKAARFRLELPDDEEGDVGIADA